MVRAPARSLREALGEAHRGPTVFHADLTGRLVVGDRTGWPLDELISGNGRIAAEYDRAQAILTQNQSLRSRGQKARKTV